MFRDLAPGQRPPESALFRGFRMGVGFMLAVVFILLVVALVWLWLSGQLSWH